MNRDKKGRFIKGNTEGKNSPISNGLATEMQARSVAARKENKTIAADANALHGYSWQRACGYNKNTSEKLAHFFGMSMADYLRWLWNNPQAGQSPYKMFEGIIAPSAEMGKDENGDLIYYYHKERTTNV